MKKILITGFTPFGGETVNPSFEAVKALPDKIDGYQVIKAEIPTVYRESGKKLMEIIGEEKPEYVLLVGQAGGRKGITPEKIAINIRNANIPDNNGKMAKDEYVNEHGEAAYFSQFNCNAIVRELEKEGIPASISYSAGTFVCNELLYTFLHENKERNLHMQGGFVHVPYCETQIEGKPADTPYLPLTTITHALEIVVKTMLASPYRY